MNTTFALDHGKIVIASSYVSVAYMYHGITYNGTSTSEPVKKERIYVTQDVVDIIHKTVLPSE
jgi:hypothetical protein